MTDTEPTFVDDETALRAEFEVREERFEHGALEMDVLLPRAADMLIDEALYEADERLPYWAELWPSARGLARHLLDHPPPETSIVELGSGVALPSLALRSIDRDPLATDYYEEALRFARVNALRNGIPPLRTMNLDWRHPPEDVFSLVIAADVLYEKRNGQALAALLPRITAPGGRVLLADPGRIHAGDFYNAMHLAGWSITEIDARVELSDPRTGATSTVRMREMRFRDLAPGD